MKEERFIVFMKNEWQISLKEFTPAIISQATDHCLKRKQLPPTLPQFYDLCRTLHIREKEQEALNNRAPNERATPASLEVGRKYLKLIKQMLTSN